VLYNACKTYAGQIASGDNRGLAWSKWPRCAAASAN